MLLYQRFRPKTLDLYVIREIVPPTLLGLLTFTFVLLLDTIPSLLKILVSRGADLVTIGRVFLNLLPSIFAVTIPMAFLLGVLLAFGRLASESELVAMRASGISPFRLLAPLLILSAFTTGVTFYINAIALPEANQAYREHVFALVVSKARSVRPRVFTDDLVPGMVVYLSDLPGRDRAVGGRAHPGHPESRPARASSSRARAASWSTRRRSRCGWASTAACATS